MASTRLAEVVGYPGSSVAFAQLLSGMERDGLIIREIRGKRTYRITLPENASAESAAGEDPAGTGLTGTGASGTRAAKTGPAGDRLPAAGDGGVLPAPTGFDYDELARRLLVQVVRRLAGTSRANAAAELATVDVAGALAESSPADSGDTNSRDSERTALRQTVTGLERELATAWTRHGTLTAENARLREQLREAQRDLARERTRRAQITSELNQAEVVLLEHLLSPSPEDEKKHPDAAAK
ncbi:MAG TPA: hypothetical protein VG142_12565 [Trebonia sp.]|jgi:hypothetical protein|nr:hypothetical protein [Trebonia sp.]